MTSRERLIAATRGGEVDRRPTLTWFSPNAEADASVLPASEVASHLDENRVVLAEVANPFGLALQRGIDLNKALKDDPSVGSEMLDGLVEEVRDRISAGLSEGADGIFYRLHGASPRHCSPMQYGGHYLERDRELLENIEEATLNVLFVAGGEELYVDFVSDLPAHVFAWDSRLSHISAEQVRTVRPGAIASIDPESDIVLTIGKERYLEHLEQPNVG